MKVANSNVPVSADENSSEKMNRCDFLGAKVIFGFSSERLLTKLYSASEFFSESFGRGRPGLLL